MPRGGTYANNSYNRSVGRVGMSMGSCVISKGSSGSSGMSSSSGRSSSYSSYSTPSKAYSSTSPQYDDFGYGASTSTPKQSVAASTPRTYTDNAFNRSHDRVGKEVGTAVISKKDGYTGHESSDSYSTPTKANSSTSSQFDDSGLGASPFYGTTYSPAPSTPKQSISTPRTYADNAFNRSHDRVGKEVGTAVISKKDGYTGHESSDSYSTPTKAYSSTSSQFDDSGLGASPFYGTTYSPAPSTPKQSISTPRTYADNAFNRSHDRVGKEVGSAVISKKDGSVVEKVYKDSSKNRALNRVGLPRGSRPEDKNAVDHSDKQYEQDYEHGKKPIPDYTDQRRLFHDNEDYISTPTLFDDVGDYRDPGNLFHDDVNDDVFPKMCKPPTIPSQTTPLTSKKEKHVDTDESIDFKSIVLKRKIGSGGFGEVHEAEWKGITVAVKTLQVQRVSKQRMKDFRAEVDMFCGLNHTNIVQYFGACLKTPNLCIVMELMEMSLFDALHFNEDIEIAEEDRLGILKQTAAGLGYLHHKKIAQCDLKTANVLLNYVPGGCEVKIGDFGLSVIKANTETSQSCIDDPVVSKIGTPKSSAPEVLRGEKLSANKMRIADIYSLGLIFYEVVYQSEPFYDLSYLQLCKQVGEKPGQSPAIPDDVHVNGTLLDLMRDCWEFQPENRKHIQEVIKELNSLENIFD